MSRVKLVINKRGSIVDTVVNGVNEMRLTKSAGDANGPPKGTNNRAKKSSCAPMCAHRSDAKKSPSVVYQIDGRVVNPLLIPRCARPKSGTVKPITLPTRSNKNSIQIM